MNTVYVLTYEEFSGDPFDDWVCESYNIKILNHNPSEEEIEEYVSNILGWEVTISEYDRDYRNVCYKVFFEDEDFEYNGLVRVSEKELFD